MTDGAGLRTGARRLPLATPLATLLLFASTAIALFVEERLRPPYGAVAHYYAGPSWTGPLRVRTTDPELTTDRLTANWPWTDETFSARWDGWVLVPEAGTYRFGAVSDDGSWVYVDGALVVDNGGRHEARMAVGDRELTDGLHRVAVEYFQGGGPAELAILWGRAGERLRVLSGPALLAADPTAERVASWRRASTARDVLFAASTIVWLLLLVRTLAVRPLRRLAVRELGGPLPAPVVGIAAAFATLAVVGLWWGLPGAGWAPDELVPDHFADALDSRFAGGWTSKYPPLQYQLVIAASLPLWILRWSDPATFTTDGGALGVFLIARTLSVVMSTGAVVILYFCARRLLRPAAALFAMVLASLLPPLVYYAKVANLDAPYLLWYLLALLAYLRLLVVDRARDWLMYAAAAALAIGTKDQAYGLFVLPTAALLARRFVRTPGRDVFDRFSRAVLAPRIVASAALAVAIFVVSHNILWNAAGFVEHVRSITGPQSRSFRMFEPGPAGQWVMLATSGRLLAAMLGSIACLLALIGAAIAAVRAERSKLWWVALAPLSYYVTFLAVVGYTYDRFLLPVAIVAALFAATAIDFLWTRTRLARAAAIASMALAIGQVALRAALVDVAMVRDSRYHIEEWLRAHADPAETIGTVGLTEYLPRLEGFHVTPQSDTQRDFAVAGASRVVANADFAARFAPGTEPYAVYHALTTGALPFRPAMSYRTALPLESFSYQTAALRVGDSFTNLTKINPTIVVFERTSR